MRTQGAGRWAGQVVQPGGLGSMCPGLRWKIPGEYRAHQWFSLAGEFGV